MVIWGFSLLSVKTWFRIFVLTSWRYFSRMRKNEKNLIFLLYMKRSFVMENNAFLRTLDLCIMNFWKVFCDKNSLLTIQVLAHVFIKIDIQNLLLNGENKAHKTNHEKYAIFYYKKQNSSTIPVAFSRRQVATQCSSWRNGRLQRLSIMMTSLNGNIFRVTGHLYGEFTGDRWIHHTKASDTELRCFLWSAPE